MTGFVFSKTASSPPHMTVSTPFSAPASATGNGGVDEVDAFVLGRGMEFTATSALAVVLSIRTAPAFAAGEHAILADRYRAQIIVITADAGKDEIGTFGRSSGRGANLPSNCPAQASALATVRL